MTTARYLTDSFAVSPQIAVEDLEGLKEQGFSTIVCNRPDGEVPAECNADAIRSACEDLGMRFVLNPLSHGELSLAHIDTQREAAKSTESVLAYCASGNRSSILWSLAMAGRLPTEEILQRTSDAGYNVHPILPQLQSLAAQAKT